MSTDLYGVRVLGVDPERREAEFRVFVVHYETASREYYEPPEHDPGFFLCLMWGRSGPEHPIHRVVSIDQALDRAWVAEHARWFVEHVERTAIRNHPPADEAWEELADFYYEDEGWENEHLLVQADYVVRFTDSAWIEHVKPGQSWGETFTPMDADCPRAEELPHVPNVHEPIILRPFEEAAPSEIAFSDDGRFLAVKGAEAELVIYDCADWSEHARLAVERQVITPRLAWVPGRHTVVLTEVELGELEQTAYDVDAGAFVDAPVELGTTRSRTGRHRVQFGDGEGIGLLAGDGDPVPVRGVEPVTIVTADFTADESRLFAAGWEHLYVIDPAAGAVLETVVHPEQEQTQRLAVSPDGAYLVMCLSGSGGLWSEEGDEVRVRRLSDGKVVVRHWPGHEVTDARWSPDGRWLALALEHDSGEGELRIVPVGMPAEPPADLFAAPD
ncbi:WD40 repeat domain-containing protein [Micromonospora sp. NPDC004336]